MAMGDLFPKIAKLKIGLPSEFHYKVGMFLDYFSYTINITNINYDDIELQMERTHLYFREGYDKHILKVDFPAIKDWVITANESVNSYIFPSKSPVKL